MSIAQAQSNVAQFMLGGGQEVRYFPTIPKREGTANEQGHSDELFFAATVLGIADSIKDSANIHQSEQLLSMALLLEEVGELFEGIAKNDLVAIADGSTDVKVIVLGIDNRFGLPADELFEEVHRSNMSKFVDGKAVRDEAGKIQKGPNYSPPQLEGILYPNEG
ncbi:nucleotide pyrophosphohydrolase [Gordonia phage Neville]|uniref:MazG-like nucleotide pyrophosphohydrolase n=2 Tax=Nevillevirus TaxID=3044773 RepID=A0A515MGZ2_9CAUD|nr:nucleotide pyrophosphohydrolase [Gordonia phage Neville]YP_010246039.1 nucleotide pyrophosphohydrolase [Gordonia phage Trax]AXQ64424.1 MazG-like nucleotide pyrophosphohydrolase [Gordonia phage Neville]QDM55941.1 MazG-like nucleotide pyrophosphohydrolase [Gordonia phage Trax]